MRFAESGMREGVGAGESRVGERCAAKEAGSRGVRAGDPACETRERRGVGLP